MSDFQECPTCASKPGAPTLCGECRARRATHYLAADALAALAGAGIATPIEGYSGAPWALKGDIQRLEKERDAAVELAARAAEALDTAHRRAANFEAALADAKAVQACTDAWLDAALEELAQVRVRAAELQAERDEARDAHLVMTRRLFATEKERDEAWAELKRLREATRIALSLALEKTEGRP